MRTTIAIAVALMLVVAGCSQAPGAGTTTDTAAETTVPPTADETTQSDSESDATTEQSSQQVVKPDDPESDVIGWEAGYWYNETIDVNPEDGLNDTELDKTVARAMARVERIRQLEFEERVPVEIQTREEFRSNQNDRSTPDDRRLFDNVKYESLFMIGESTDSIAVQNRNSGSSVGGFYSPSEEKIVVVSENASTPKLDEITLSQELFHALQDQKFNLSKFDQSTRELHNAKDGVIEGDGNYVDHLYSERCKDEWNGDCLSDSGSGTSGDLANIGPYLIKFQPYSDGPPFVRGVQQRGGWEAVNDLYENPPASTEQVIHPDKYGKDSPAEFDLEDRTSNGWERLELQGRPSYGSVGEAGIFAMFMYPYYPSQGQTQIVPAREFFNTKQGTDQVRQFDPLNYNSTYSAGWDGDKLAVYTNDVAKANETGYVWKSVWDSEQDAAEFVEGYRQVLEYNDATKVDGRPNTWRIEGNGFADAFYVQQKGDTVVIVNAPTVSDLSDVRQGAAPKQ
ncbi:Hvo_1808 family surface protein [Halorussus salinisoli]|uniref:Hvo_1808 family surface protein n=1 Tax=Halorussus salinisoli TaxID=2558242 RepID=UPI0010C2374F|nr:Hvo_1808 family surface protein [Halorussus salinisoli]